jgi:hypothetical protein
MVVTHVLKERLAFDHDVRGFQFERWAFVVILLRRVQVEHLATYGHGVKREEPLRDECGFEHFRQSGRYHSSDEERLSC